MAGAAGSDETKAAGFVRFIIVSGARTGSTMLARALNSSPQVRCFGEAFNAAVDFVPFDVEGFDNFSGRERQLRQRDAVAFLRERVFGPTPADVRAVGFKLLYDQQRGFPGLEERLVDDRELRVIHLRRRNLLRMLVSAKIAQETDIWAEPVDLSLGRTLTPANALRAARHPLRAASSLRRRLRLMAAPATTGRRQVALTREECEAMFRFIKIREIHYDTAFFSHPRLTLSYEDLVARPEEEFARAQSFLGLEPAALSVPLRRQNPEPLRDLLSNYDELREAWRGTEYEGYLE